MIVDEDAGSKPVGGIELVGNIPAERTVLPPLLHDGMQKGNSVDKWNVLSSVTLIQHVLIHSAVGREQPGSYTWNAMSCHVNSFVTFSKLVGT